MDMFFRRNSDSTEVAVVSESGVTQQESADLHTAAPYIDEALYIRNTAEEVIIRRVPDGVTVSVDSGGARILVFGDVGRNACVFARGGGARVEIMGSLMEGARVAARGGGAHVMIFGVAYPGSFVGAQGGGARVEFFSHSSAQPIVDGGGAETLYF